VAGSPPKLKLAPRTIFLAPALSSTNMFAYVSATLNIASAATIASV